MAESISITFAVNPVDESLMNKVSVFTKVLGMHFEGPVRVMLGGSHRFDYHIRSPRDIDLFICCNKEDLNRFAEVWGLYPEEHVDYIPADSQIKGVPFMTEQFDLSFYHSEVAFDELLETHRKMDLLLAENGGTVRTLLKHIDMRGVVKYQKLLHILRDREREHFQEEEQISASEILLEEERLPEHYGVPGIAKSMVAGVPAEEDFVGVSTEEDFACGAV